MKNKTQTMINNSVKANKKMGQKAAKKRIQAEANARRRIARSWAVLSQGIKYQKAAMKESSNRLTKHLKEELFDGIFLNLQGRNGTKSYSYQKRVLRRIVEKRQAQTVHRLMGKCVDRYAEHIQRHCASQSLKQILQYLCYV